MRKPYANKITDMLEKLVRPYRINEEDGAIKESAEHGSFANMKSELKTIKPVSLRKGCEYLLNQVLKLKFSKGELQPDKDLDWWTFALFDDGDHYSFVLEFPVNWNKCPEKYRGIEKYHTRDDVLSKITSCDLDTSDIGLVKKLPKGCEVYNVGFYFNPVKE